MKSIYVVILATAFIFNSNGQTINIDKTAKGVVGLFGGNDKKKPDDKKQINTKEPDKSVAPNPTGQDNPITANTTPQGKPVAALVTEETKTSNDNSSNLEKSKAKTIDCGCKFGLVNDNESYNNEPLKSSKNDGALLCFLNDYLPKDSDYDAELLCLTIRPCNVGNDKSKNLDYVYSTPETGIFLAVKTIKIDYSYPTAENRKRLLTPYKDAIIKKSLIKIPMNEVDRGYNEYDSGGYGGTELCIPIETYTLEDSNGVVKTLFLQNNSDSYLLKIDNYNFSRELIKKLGGVDVCEKNRDKNILEWAKIGANKYLSNVLSEYWSKGQYIEFIYNKDIMRKFTSEFDQKYNNNIAAIKKQGNAYKSLDFGDDFNSVKNKLALLQIKYTIKESNESEALDIYKRDLLGIQFANTNLPGVDALEALIKTYPENDKTLLSGLKLDGKIITCESSGTTTELYLAPTVTGLGLYFIAISFPLELNVNQLIDKIKNEFQPLKEEKKLTSIGIFIPQTDPRLYFDKELVTPITIYSAQKDNKSVSIIVPDYKNIQVKQMEDKAKLKSIADADKEFGKKNNIDIAKDKKKGYEALKPALDSLVGSIKEGIIPRDGPHKLYLDNPDGIIVNVILIKQIKSEEIFKNKIKEFIDKKLAEYKKAKESDNNKTTKESLNF